MNSKSKEKIEVIQQLMIRGGDRQVEIRNAILMAAGRNWHHHAEMEERVVAHNPGSEVLILRQSNVPFGAPILHFDWRIDGYVLSLLISESGPVSIQKQNDILYQFVEEVLKLASTNGGFEIFLSEREKSIEELLPLPAARAFKELLATNPRPSDLSRAPNKSLFEAFIISAHNLSVDPHQSYIANWMIAIEGWGPEQAFSFEEKVQFGIELLKAYSHSKSADLQYIS